METRIRQITQEEDSIFNSPTLLNSRGELEHIRHLITKVYPAGVISLVADTWDFYQVITEYTLILKPEIMARDGKVVFRPDSGDPVKIICGDPEAPRGSPEFKGAIECLWEVFGGTETSTGHKLLDSHVGLIYGDSITLDRAQRILAGLDAKGFASANVVLGIGSFTYQFCTRDNFGSAVKATYGSVNGVGRELWKDPKTDSGTKKSARGLLRVDMVDGEMALCDRQTWDQEADGLLEPVFCDGKVIRDQTLQDIRQRLLGG